MSNEIIGFTEDDVVAMIGRQQIQIAALQRMLVAANAKILELSKPATAEPKTEG